MAGRRVHERVSFDVNPTSREMYADLAREGWLFDLIAAGARVHQSGCLGCIGMGQAPAVGRSSLRTMPRNFPGRSGTDEDSVWLCSPETAAAAALTGEITDPRDLDMEYPQVQMPQEYTISRDLLTAPLPPEQAREVELVKGSNIYSLPEFDPIPDELDLPILLKVGDDVSTDEIMPAGSRVLPYRSNIPKISEFVFVQVDDTYSSRAAETEGGHAVVGGTNYGQGSSREHAVVAPRYLGLKVVVAKSIARIHWQNLANFGVLALEFADEADYEAIEQGEVLSLRGLHEALHASHEVGARIGDRDVTLKHRLSERQVEMVLAGGRIAHHARSTASTG